MSAAAAMRLAQLPSTVQVSELHIYQPICDI